MKRSRWQAPTGFMAAMLSGPAWAAEPPLSGTINNMEGQASMGGQALGQSSAGSVRLRAGQSLSTQDGRAEVLITPGVFLRIGNNSNIRIDVSGASAQLLKPGLYDIEADHGEIRVFDGKAVVQVNGRQAEVKGEHEFNLNTQVAQTASVPGASEVSTVGEDSAAAREDSMVAAVDYVAEAAFTAAASTAVAADIVNRTKSR